MAGPVDGTEGKEDLPPLALFEPIKSSTKTQRRSSASAFND